MKSIIRQFPIARGIDEGTDPKMQAPGSLLSLVNSVWRKDGRVEKRYGTDGQTKAIVGGGSIGAGSRLFTRGVELGLITDSRVYAYSGAGWRLTENLGKISEVGLTWETLQDGYAGVSSSDAAITSDGLLVHAWVTGDPTVLPPGGELYYQIIDRDDATRSTQPVLLSSAAGWVRVLTSGTDWIVVFNDAGNIKCSVNGTSVATLRADGEGSGAAFDACIVGSLLVIAYHLAANGIGLYSYSIASTPVQQASGAVTGEATTTCHALSIDGVSGETLWIGYHSDTEAFRIAAANPTTLAQTLAPTTIESIPDMIEPTVSVKRATATTCLYAFSTNNGAFGGNYIDGVTSTRVVSTAAAVTAIRYTHFVRALSRPFYLGSTPYILVANFLTATGIASSTFPAGGDSFLMEVATSDVAVAIPHRYVGHLDVLIAGNWARGAFANVMPVSATEAQCVIPFMSRAPTGPTAWRQGCRVASMTIGASRPADMWRPVQLGAETYLSAGVLSAYDGRQCFDYGFAHPPCVDMTTTVASASGGAMATGNYVYAIVPEYQSNAGVLHRGPASRPETIAVTGPNGSVALAVIPVHLSQKQPDRGLVSIPEPIPVLLATHRSPVGQPTPQRLTCEPTFNVLLQDPQGSPQTLTDTRLDTNLGTSALRLARRPALYTAGGELDDFQPPSSLTLMLHQNRLWSLSGDKRTVWISKDHSANVGTAPGFHPSVTLNFDRDLTAFTSMDDKAAVFALDRLWAVLGNGPAPNGNDSDFQIIPIQSDVGCTNPRSLVSTPDGAMFLSARGFCLLTRALEVVFLGKQVDDKLRDFPNVTSAVLVPAQNQIRWTCNNAAGTAGCVIVLDYATKQWSVFEYYDSDEDLEGTPIADAIMWNGAWSFVTPTGKVYREDAATHLDDGEAWVQASGELAWIGEGGPLGFQHIRRAFVLGDKLTDCNFTLKFAFNHKAGFPQSHTWTHDELTEFDDGVNVGMRVGSQNGASPRCRAFRIAWEDSAPDPESGVPGTGAGFNLSAIGIEFIPKPHMDRRSARART